MGQCMERAIEAEVRRRAGGYCEYCRFPEAAFRMHFQIDHIIARQHGGATAVDNLALACARCNLHKGPNIAGLDPQTGRLTRLFHPRRDEWSEHFVWDGALMRGATAAGRTTVMLLKVNDEGAVAVRHGLMEEGIFASAP